MQGSSQQWIHHTARSDVFFMDSSKQNNIVHYENIRLCRIRKSVLSTEQFTTTGSFRLESTIGVAFDRSSRFMVRKQFYTDSNSLYDCMENINFTAKWFHLMDLRMLRQSHEWGQKGGILDPDVQPILTKKWFQMGLCKLLRKLVLESKQRIFWGTKKKTCAFWKQRDQ